MEQSNLTFEELQDANKELEEKVRVLEQNSENYKKWWLEESRKVAKLKEILSALSDAYGGDSLMAVVERI